MLSAWACSHGGDAHGGTRPVPCLAPKLVRAAPGPGARSHVFAPAHPGEGCPAPDRRQVRGEQPLDEHGRDGLILSTPALVRPAIRPASTTPRPPGTGTAPPTIEASVMTTCSVAMLSCGPTACSDAPRAMATSS